MSLGPFIPPTHPLQRLHVHRLALDVRSLGLWRVQLGSVWLLQGTGVQPLLPPLAVPAAAGEHGLLHSLLQD